jgi:hypothetical protein
MLCERRRFIRSGRRRVPFRQKGRRAVIRDATGFCAYHLHGLYCVIADALGLRQWKPFFAFELWMLPSVGDWAYREERKELAESIPVVLT